MSMAAWLNAGGRDMQDATGTRMLTCYSLGSFAEVKPASGAVNDSLPCWFKKAYICKVSPQSETYNC